MEQSPNHSTPQLPPSQATVQDHSQSASRKWSWSRITTFAGLIILGITPWAQAQLPPPNLPAVCPPLTAFASPSLFDFFWGTTPIRFPYE